ncbi:hypothetical protein BGZ65_008243 [Modicella reniformis]|uniref:NAD(P)-binding domain-containing protein n=1 Tax=Modicella reniformis TaxID=1440133 RepID=A0A9P6M876_9FUNG|nr:hypothetical protein BGZ65_008243 [Modicella reniformis]
MKSNCKIVQISYNEPTSIAIALRGIQTVVLVPEIEDQRVDWVNQMVDTMAQENVVRCILISSIGTDATEKEQLNRFVRTEDKVKGSIQRWTILREGFPFQALFYWISMIQDQGVLGMSIKPEVEFAPLDISNLGDALVSVTFPSNRVDPDRSDQDQDSGHSEQGTDTTTVHDNAPSAQDDLERFDGQIYTLTGPETITGPKLVEELNRMLNANSEKNHKARNASGRQEGDVPTPVIYKHLTRDEVRAYLIKLRDRGARQKLVQRFESMDLLGVHGALRLFRRATTAAFGTLRAQSDSSSTASSSCQEGDEEHGKDVRSSDASPKRLQLPEEPFEPDQPGKPDEPGTRPSRHLTPQLEAPNDAEVDLVLDLLDYISEGRATFQSGDLEKVAGIRGANAKNFFEKYEQDFQQPEKRP